MNWTKKNRSWSSVLLKYFIDPSITVKPNVKDYFGYLIKEKSKYHLCFSTVNVLTKV